MITKDLGKKTLTIAAVLTAMMMVMCATVVIASEDAKCDASSISRTISADAGERISVSTTGQYQNITIESSVSGITVSGDTSGLKISGTISTPGVYALIFSADFRSDALHSYTNNTYTYTINIESVSTEYTAKLIYNANGGSGAPSTQTKTASFTGSPGTAVFTVSNVEPTMDGYNFLGWSDYKNATTASYHGGNSKSVTYGYSATLYAIWSYIETEQTYVATLAFNTEGGSAIDTQTNSVTSSSVPSQYRFTITNTVPEKTGYKFLGWGVYSGDTIPNYYPGDKLYVSYSTTTTLYAIWVSDSLIIVSFDSNGGSFCNKIAVELGNEYGTLPTTTYLGYTFQGWFIGDVLIESTTVISETADHTLTALWQSNSSSSTVPTVSDITVDYPDENSTLTVRFTVSALEADSFLWYFGDEETSKIRISATHTYETYGDYTVTLICSNSAGDTTKTTTVNISIPDPSENAVHLVNYVYSFDYGGADQPTVTGCSWLTATLEDGKVCVSGIPQDTDTIGQTYTVTLHIGTLTKTWDIAVYQNDGHPIAGFTISVNEGKVTVTSTAINASQTYYSWISGSSMVISTTNSTNHTYTESGTYTITQKVTKLVDGVTLSDTISKNVTVNITKDKDNKTSEFDWNVILIIVCIAIVLLIALRFLI